jgi:exodeoxyribonuclease V alpha subunit
MKDILEGQLSHIIYRNEENGYTVGRLAASGELEEAVITGTMMGVQVGENLICHGSWKNTDRYGKQFQVESFEVRMPTTKDGVEKYLSAGQIAGIGPVYAKRIVQKFGTATFDILDEQPEKLLEVEGIGKKTLGRIIKSWHNQQNAREIVLFLQQYQISPLYALRIFKQYGDRSVEKIKENPYRLAEEVVGIGFKKADEIARQMEIGIESPLRVDAGIDYALMQQNRQGHSCYPLDEFCEEAAQLLSVSQDLVQTRLGNLVQQNKIVVDSFNFKDQGPQTYIWRRPLFLQEQQIVQESMRLLSHTESWLAQLDFDQAISQASKSLKINLAQQQEEAVEASISNKIHIITGGPGTGKSTITKVILKVLSNYREKILLAAPTGRAAKRLTEITGREAQTIHSLLSLDFSGGSFLNSRLSEPLDAEVLIVDEASMIDTALMAVLLSCLPDQCKLILVGDVDQLPSVGPGNVLNDMILAGQIPVTRLTEIFRQATDSQIVMNAHKINNGLFPDIQINKDGDFFFIQEKKAEKIAQLLVNLIKKRLPQAYQLHPLKDIQLLCPMHKSEIGTQRLNEEIQKALNDPDSKKEIAKRGGLKFSVGDKVMQIKNNYEKSVFNGDIGFIKKIKTVDKLLIVEMDDSREVEYEFSELNELELAYAVTVHKYQGSEAPCIIMPIHESQYSLLFRNLLYTAVTRGKKLVILVGSKEALLIAVKNDRARDRFSALAPMFNYEEEQAFPPIKIVPALGSSDYKAWLEEAFPEEIE